MIRNIGTGMKTSSLHKLLLIRERCKYMYRVLFLPLLQMPSGHHHVADCIQHQLESSSKTFHCEKIDLLSHSYGRIEQFISYIYIQWIHKFPKCYSAVYRYSAVNGGKRRKNYRLYEQLFLRNLLKILDDKKPDLCICTHALPSYMLACLKERKLWSGKVINIYTDYFINDLWGGKEIDYHFAPSMRIKEGLIKKGILPEQVMCTGIPINPIFKKEKPFSNEESMFNVLVSGGNMGAGPILEFVKRLRPTGIFTYKVLCGKNERLFQTILQMEEPLIQPLPYISSKAEMNRLYDEADFIITKPGGVTISECLAKQLPVFVYDALPGQEEQNLNYLTKKKLVFYLANWKSSNNIEEKIKLLLEKQGKDNKVSMNHYSNEIELDDPVSFITSLLSNK